MNDTMNDTLAYMLALHNAATTRADNALLRLAVEDLLTAVDALNSGDMTLEDKLTVVALAVGVAEAALGWTQDNARGG